MSVLSEEIKDRVSAALIEQMQALSQALKEIPPVPFYKKRQAIPVEYEVIREKNLLPTKSE